MTSISLATTESATPGSADAVREMVREHYSQRVQTSIPCCGPSDSACCSDADGALYSADELADIPSDAANFSMGCGNPQVIAALQPGETVLDLGSGGGIDVLLAARQVGADGFVYGVDMTDDMLALARRNADKMGATNVEFRKGHIEDIPLAENTVDVIMSNCVINLSPDKGQVLDDALRVLRPGGRLAISDIVIDGDLSDLPVSEEQVRTALSWAGCIAGALTKQEYLELLNAAGYEDADVSFKHHYTLEALGQDMESASQLLPADVIEQLVGRFGSAAVTARKPQAA